jgi:hypothetical protein
MVGIAISNKVTGKRWNLLYSSWSNVPTLTLLTLLASLWFIPYTIKHLTHQQSQHTIPYSMLQTWSFCLLMQEHTANQTVNSLNDVIQQMKARVDCGQKGSKPLEYCAAYNLQCIVRWRQDEKCTVYATPRMRNGLRIVSREKSLSQNSPWTCRESNYARAGRYEKFLKGRIHNQNAQKYT